MAARHEAALAKHRAAAREVTCAGCNLRFCPLHGAGSATLCPVCSAERERRRRRAHEARRKKRRAAEVTGKPGPATPNVDFGHDNQTLHRRSLRRAGRRCEPPPPDHAGEHD